MRCFFILCFLIFASQDLSAARTFFDGCIYLMEAVGRGLTGTGPHPDWRWNALEDPSPVLGSQSLDEIESKQATYWEQLAIKRKQLASHFPEAQRDGVVEFSPWGSNSNHVEARLKMPDETRNRKNFWSQVFKYNPAFQAYQDKSTRLWMIAESGKHKFVKAKIVDLTESTEQFPVIGSLHFKIKTITLLFEDGRLEVFNANDILGISGALDK